VTSGHPVPLGSVPVGLDPVSVRFRNNNEVWVVNHISDSVSLVDVGTLRVSATIDTLETPEDVVFAGSSAFVSCALPNALQVFNQETRQLVTNVAINAERPKALAVSADGQKVYAAIFESGNGTTLVGPKFRNLLFFDNVVSVTNGPYAGQNPPPNRATSFDPSINPALPTNVPLPKTGIIVRKTSSGRWLDDNQHDWTEFVSGTNAPLTQRVQGWDLPDRDLAIVNASDFSVSYATGLMNICMALDVNPASGRLAVVGTDAINQVRFEPNLNGIFVRVNLAMVDPLAGTKSITDLNPHLDYSVRTLPQQQRDKSIGDPRAIVWNADGTRAYIAGMGSRNVVIIDMEGNRIGSPIDVGEGPAGLALDEPRHRLYVWNRFSSSISVVDTSSDSVIEAIPVFDPTPTAIAAGRRHLYDTRRTSGLGQASCASCHIDARMDRLGWDLSNPSGDSLSAVVNHQGILVTNDYHPMKGVMVTQTLQDIIGHEPFHWRGDRLDIESFNATFTNLQAAPAGLRLAEMRELRDFLASIHFPPNRLREFDNTFSTNVPLPGHVALGQDVLPVGAPLSNGNAEAGSAAFRLPGNFCTTCHTLPTGLGINFAQQNGTFQEIPPGTNGGHHLSLAFRLEGDLRSKVAQFRNMADKIGMDGTRTESRAGFGFGHDGSIDSLTRFLNGVRIVTDQDVADLIAFLLSVSGSDTSSKFGVFDDSVPSAVGRQLTLASPERPALFDAMLALARSQLVSVDLIAKGTKDDLPRGWYYDRTLRRFQSDRRAEIASAEELLALAAPGNQISFTVVPRGSGVRLGIDRDLDDTFDRDELDAGSNPADPPSPLRVIAASQRLAAGGDLLLHAQIAPLPASLTGLIWQKDSQPIDNATNEDFATNVPLSASGEYRFVASTIFQSYTSPPVRITVEPLLVAVVPAEQSVRLGSNSVFTANVVGNPSFQFQWRFNGKDLGAATASTLTISNAQLANEGLYELIAANSFGAVTSNPVRLNILINPTLTVPPLNQNVVEGGNATFSFMISGHPPPFGYLLRKSSTVLTNYTSNDRMAFLTLFNVQPSNAGTYRIVVTNAANPLGLSLDPVTLTVLADSDHDGLPDEWETAHGLAMNNPADAQFDSDLDGQRNLQEYLAGTDPQDPQSFLKLDRVLLEKSPLALVIEFNAISNRTYTLQTTDRVRPDSWNRVSDIVALPTNRVVSLTNVIAGPGAAYYRLATPRVP